MDHVALVPEQYEGHAGRVRRRGRVGRRARAVARMRPRVHDVPVIVRIVVNDYLITISASLTLWLCLPFHQLGVVETVPVRDRVDEDEPVRPGDRVGQGHFRIHLQTETGRISKWKPMRFQTRTQYTVNITGKKILIAILKTGGMS